MDFLIARSENPEWVSGVLASIIDPPDIVRLILLVAGIWLLLRSSEKRISGKLNEIDAALEILRASQAQISSSAQFVADARALNELRGKGDTLRKAAEQFIAARERCEAWNAGDLEGENKLRFEGRVQRETGEAWQSALIAMTGAIADMIDNHDSPPHINLDRAVPGEREDPNKKFLFRKMTHEHDQILVRYSTAVQRYGTNFNWLSKSTASIAEPLSLPSIGAKMRL